MINYQDKGIGLTVWLDQQGVILEQAFTDGVGVWQSNVPDDQINALIEQYNPWVYVKADKLAEIDEDFQKTIDGLTAGWPEGEIKTWAKQESEALALQSNPSASTPFLTMIAAQRGITVADLASRVLRDSAAFSNASAYYVGLRHKARQLVQALPNEGSYERLQELNSIKFGG